jgi:hypothetical protein
MERPAIGAKIIAPAIEQLHRRSTIATIHAGIIARRIGGRGFELVQVLDAGVAVDNSASGCRGMMTQAIT